MNSARRHVDYHHKMIKLPKIDARKKSFELDGSENLGGYRLKPKLNVAKHGTITKKKPIG